MSPVEALEAASGYVFKDKALAERALCHSSTEKRPSNERLEFLGDRVLALAVGTQLYYDDTLPDEGAMAKQLNARVCREACADAARLLGLGDLLQMSSGEHRGGGRGKVGILSDAMEAVIGAVYLDGGAQPAIELVRRLWSRLQFDHSDDTDTKGCLQVMAHRRGFPLPEYRLIGRRGPDHAPRFTVAVALPGLEAVEAVGASRRDAERAAAARMLQLHFSQNSNQAGS